MASFLQSTRTLLVVASSSTTMARTPVGVFHFLGAGTDVLNDLGFVLANAVSEHLFSLWNVPAWKTSTVGELLLMESTVLDYG